MDRITKIIFSIEKELGLNQVQLADLLKVTPQSITKWKSRKKIPEKTKYYLITELGISESFLNTGEGEFYENNEMPKKSDKLAQKDKEENKNVENTIECEQLKKVIDDMEVEKYRIELENIKLEAQVEILQDTLVKFKKED